MRIAAYNIQSGGFSGFNTDEKRPERLKNIKRAIEILNSDILVLIETYRWIDIFDANDLEELFKYESAF